MFFKVVLVDKDDRLVSTFARAKYIQRVYVPNKWTEPNPYMLSKGYGLFVYSDHDTAMNKMDWYKRCFDGELSRRLLYVPKGAKGAELWECEVGSRWLSNTLLDMWMVGCEDNYNYGKRFYERQVKTTDPFYTFMNVKPRSMLQTVYVTDKVKLVNCISSVEAQ